MSSLFSTSKVQDVFDPSLTALFTSANKTKKTGKSRNDPLKLSAATSLSEGENGATPGTRSANSKYELDETSSTSSSSQSQSRQEPKKSPEVSLDGVEPRSTSSKRSDRNNGVPLRPSNRKRKRDDDDDLEGRHLQRLAAEEARENSHMQEINLSRRENELSIKEEGSSESVSDADEMLDEFPIKHETLASSGDSLELEKASRTVFVANVSTSAMTSKPHLKTLKDHLTSFSSAPTKGEDVPKIESLRFRSTAYAGKLPKKAAFARKEIMSATAKSTNIYVVFANQKAAREAANHLNGTVVLGRHIRVDQVAHPAKIDHHRCVFVGNLGFVDEPGQIAESVDGQANKPKHRSQQGDVEEGLWQQFSKAGEVESVRVPRDPKTRVGKGFAYVQFKDENSVESALLFNDKKFPPLLPRPLRVVRAKKVRKDGSTGATNPSRGSKSLASKMSFKKDHVGDATLKGRAKKLLGRAGASQIQKLNHQTIRSPESIIFEGHRASNNSGNSGLKLNKSAKKTRNPQNKRAKRARSWKAKGKAKN